jgi:segregation and condensation protein B
VTLPTDQPDAPETTAPVPAASEISGALEALLLLADEPMTELALAEAVGAPEPVTLEALEALATFYDETGRGFELRRVGGGWRYWTRVEHADLIAAYVVAGQSGRLSQAALETLAVIAYQQPVSRGRVAAIRGVNVDGVIKTLLARGLVEEAGHDAETGAAVFATTQQFLEKMGLDSLDDLPALAPHLPEVEELEAELGQLAAVRDTGPAPEAGEAPSGDAQGEDASRA